jgi:hypothetical protein
MPAVPGGDSSERLPGSSDRRKIHMDHVILRDFDIDLEKSEVMRLLGHRGESAREPGERLESALAEAMERAGELISAAGIYVDAAGADLPGSKVFEELERVVYCVCTIGPSLEEEVTRLSEKNELLRAVVLDAVGSVAAEAVAEYMDRAIREMAAAEGLKTSCRASPGYGDWDVREQRAIFEIVPAGEIGVGLSESAMMIPRKSVSFAIHVDENPARMRSENSCRNCDRTDCAYRLLE